MPSALLIEDDAHIARLLMLELGRENWQVLWRPAGREGLETLESESVDIVLLDLMLPDIDGLTVCGMIRQQIEVPLLILTARDAVMDRVRGLDAGADDYLVKPFAMSELLARMRAVIRRSHTLKVSSPSEWLRVGALRLSERRHEVRVFEKAVELTAREFALLQYLMENVEVVVTRNMILDRVWGWGYRGSSAVVDVYMGYLRRKLDWSRAGVSLTTVRGVGYLLHLIDRTT